MREQTIRLNKTPGTEVSQGVIQSGVTQTSNMPFVQQQKTKGQRLAETFGMLVDSGSKLAAKGVELYKGQKDEEAINQFNADKYRFLEELNGLNSDADRVMWVQNKSKELSDAGVNERYRNAFLNSFDGMYNKFLAGAKEEGYKVQEGLLLNDFSVGILEGRSYDEITAKYHNVLPKDRYHKLYAGALLSNASLDAQSNTIRTPEDLKAFKDKYKGLIAEYNANPYLGGSKAATAVDIKTKLIDGIDKIGKSFDAQFKEQYQVEKATIERDLSMTPAAFEKFVSNDYQDPSEAIKAVTDYTKEYNEQQQLFTYKNNFRFNNPTNNTNWEMLSEKEKTLTKELVAGDISYHLQQGTYRGLVETVVNNTKASDGVIKNFFNTATTNPDMTKKQLTAYKGLKNTRNGNMVLYNLSKNDRTTLEILSVYPETDVQSIRDVLNSDLKTVNQFGDKNKYAKDWNKITAKLSPKDRETADALRLYILNTTGDAKASIDFVEDNFLETVSKKIGGNRILGRVTEEQAEADMVDINLVYEGYDYDTVHYDDDGSIVVSNSETPFVKSRITREDLNKASASIRTQQQLEAKLDQVETEINDLTQGQHSDIIVNVKEGIKDLYKNNSDIIGVLETEGATPDVITNIKDRFKAWSNRVNGTDFKLSTDPDYNDSTVEVDNVIDTVIDALGPTKAQGATFDKAINIYASNLNKTEGNYNDSSFLHKPNEGSGITIGPGLDAAYTTRNEMKALGVPDRILKQLDFLDAFNKKTKAVIPSNLKLERMTKKEFETVTANIANKEVKTVNKIRKTNPKLSDKAIGVLLSLKHWAGSFKSSKESKTTRWSSNAELGEGSTNGKLISPIVENVLNNKNATDDDLLMALDQLRTSYTQFGKGENSLRYKTISKYMEILIK